MTEEQLTARILSDDELWKIPPDGTANPFRHVTHDDIGLKNCKRWGVLHYCHGGRGQVADTPAALDASVDPMDMLLDKMDELDGQRLFFAPVECGGLAVHPIGVNPKDAEAVTAYELRLADMHARQVMVLPPERPGQPLRQVPVAESTEPQPFEDSDESKRLRGQLQRGD